MRLIEYNMRKFDFVQTKQRAKRIADHGIKVPYRLLTRNCENFATICVVGNDDIDVNLSDSVTQQGRSLFYGVFNCICIGSRFVRSLVSFFLYITFIAGDNIIDVVPKSSAALFSKLCSVNATTTEAERAHRICHLKIQSIFMSAYLLYVIIDVTLKCSAKFICKRCKTASILKSVFRFLLYCLLEILLIWFEPSIFTKVKKNVLNNNKNSKALAQFLLVIIVFLKSTVECTLIYWMSNFIAQLVPPYLVGKKSINGSSLVQNLKIGDVINWKRGVFRCSIDAIVTNVYPYEGNGTVNLDIVYQECCTWSLFCSKVIKQTDVGIEIDTIKVYDFSDFSHKYSPEEVVANALKAAAGDDCRCRVYSCNRSSSFCYWAKVKDISCDERFNCCERCCRSICCI